MKFKRLSAIFSATVLSISSLLTIGLVPLVGATAHNCTWTGATNNNFNTANNWSSCNSTVPQSGDNLVFDVTSLSASKTLTNDITGLSVGTITFQGTSGSSYGFTLTGNTITVASSIADNTSSPCDIDNNLTLGGSTVTMAVANGDFLQLGANTAGTLNLNSDTLNVTGQASIYDNLSGGGTFVSNNSSTLLGGDDTSWTGTIQATDGLTIVGTKPLNNTGITVTIPSGQTLFIFSPNGGTIPANITVGGSGLSGFNGAIVSTSEGQGTSANITFSGTLTLTANTTVDPGGGITTFSGPLSGNFTLTPGSGVQGSVVISSSNNQSATPNGTGQAPAQTVTIASGDNQTSQYVEVGNNITEVLDGERGVVSVDKGGTLKGDGQAESILINSGGTLSPGHSPGCLTVAGTQPSDGLQIAGTYQAELGGTTACTGYDQVKVTGIVTLNDGSQSSPVPGTLAVSLVNGFKPSKGQTFEIVSNDGTDPVVGTFSNLPEGATFTVNGYVFKISYKGGDGNDVVLTVESVPATPDTGFGLVAAHPAATLGMTVVAAGFIFGIAQKTRRLAPAHAKVSRKRR